MALSNKQKAFIAEYLQCWNGAEAARRAGYSEKTASSIAYEMLNEKPEIAEAIQDALRRKVMSADEVLFRLSEQAQGAHSAYIGADGDLDIGALVADGKAHLIKRIRDTQHGRDYEFHDSQAALQLVGRHYGLFTDKVESNNTGEVVFRVAYD